MARPWQSNGENEVWKGIAAGIAGGLLASWIMNQLQAALSRLEGESLKLKRPPPADFPMNIQLR